MSGEEEEQSVEPGTPERQGGRDAPIADADPVVDPLRSGEFEAAWAELGEAAASAIADEVARVAARDGDVAEVSPHEIAADAADASPPHDRSSRLGDTSPEAVRRSSPPPPPPAKPLKSTPPVAAAKSPVSATDSVETESSGEPDLIALSRSPLRSASAVAVPPPVPAPQVIRVVQAPPRSTMERKLLVTLIVLLVAVNGYYVATRERVAAPVPAPQAVERSPEPASGPAADAAAPSDVRPAAIALPPTPTPIPTVTPDAAVAIPPPAPLDQPSDPTEEPLVIEPDSAIERDSPTSRPRSMPRPRKPKPTPALPERDPPIPTAEPPVEPTPKPITPSPFDDAPPPSKPAPSSHGP